MENQDQNSLDFTSTGEFSRLLKTALDDPKQSGFLDAPEDQKGLLVNSWLQEFVDGKGIADDKEISALKQTADTILSQEKVKLGLPRYRPDRETASTLYPEYPEKLKSKDLNDYISKVDEWKNAATDQSNNIRPSDQTDIGIDINDRANYLITQAASDYNKTGWVWDKSSRVVEGAAKPFYDLLDKEGSDRYFAENFAQDPEKDKDLSSQFFGGFGQLASQIGIMAITSATVGPEAVPAVIGALYTGQYIKNGYDEEFKRSGDETRAANAAVSQIPAAFLDSFADTLLMRSGSISKNIAKQILEAPSEAAKRELLKSALPSISKEMGFQMLSEGTLGGIGAEFASGYGAYKATGDESYLRSTKELLESGLVEGSLGALFGGGMAKFNQNSGIKEVAGQLNDDIAYKQANQQKIFEALKKGDYQGAIGIVEESRKQFPYNINTTEQKDLTKPTDQSAQPSVSATAPKDNYKTELLALTKRLRQVKDNPTESTRLKQKIDDINSGKYSPLDEFESGEMEDANDLGNTDEFSTLTLSDGTVLESPTDGQIVYVKANDKGSLRSAAEVVGTDKIKIGQNKGGLTLDFIGNGRGEGGKDFRQSFQIETSPTVGYIPVHIQDVKGQNGVKRKIKILGAKITSFEVLDTTKPYEVKSKTDDSVTVSQGGKDRTLTGWQAKAVINKQTQDKALEAQKVFQQQQEKQLNKQIGAEKKAKDFLDKNDSDFKQLDYLLNQSNDNSVEWTDKEKKAYAAQVERLTGKLQKYSDLHREAGNSIEANAMDDMLLHIMNFSEQINANKNVGKTEQVFSTNPNKQQITPQEFEINDSNTLGDVNYLNQETGGNLQIFYNGKPSKITVDNGQAIASNEEGDFEIGNENISIKELRENGHDVSVTIPETQVNQLTGVTGTSVNGGRVLKSHNIDSPPKVKISPKKKEVKSVNGGRVVNSEQDNLDDKQKEAVKEGFGKDYFVHRTRNEIKSFDKSKTNNDKRAYYGRGFYFHKEGQEKDIEGFSLENYGDKIVKVFLKLKKPWIVSSNRLSSLEKSKQFDLVEKLGDEKLIERLNDGYSIDRETILWYGPENFSNLLKKNGYDGVIYDAGERGSEYVVFDESQIKIASNGSLSTKETTNTNITESNGVEYSAVELDPNISGVVKVKSFEALRKEMEEKSRLAVEKYEKEQKAKEAELQKVSDEIKITEQENIQEVLEITGAENTAQLMENLVPESATTSLLKTPNPDETLEYDTKSNENISEDLKNKLDSLDFTHKQISGSNKGKLTKKVLISPDGEVIPVDDSKGHPDHVLNKLNRPEYITEKGKPDVRKMVDDGWYWGSISKDENGNYAFIDFAEPSSSVNKNISPFPQAPESKNASTDELASGAKDVITKKTKPKKVLYVDKSKVDSKPIEIDSDKIENIIYKPENSIDILQLNEEADKVKMSNELSKKADAAFEEMRKNSEGKGKEKTKALDSFVKAFSEEVAWFTAGGKQYLNYLQKQGFFSEEKINAARKEQFVSKLKEEVNKTIKESSREEWNKNIDLVWDYVTTGKTNDFIKGTIKTGFVDSVKEEIYGKEVKFDKDGNEILDKVTKQFLAGERNEARANEEASNKASREPVKVRYSLAPQLQSTDSKITLDEAADFIAELGTNIVIEDTNKVTEDGHSWSGRTDFTNENGKVVNPVITININNIRDVEHLRDVINEEMSHVVYNDSELKPIVNEILAVVQNDATLLETYKEDDLTEESAVRFMSDLAKKFDDKSIINKLYTALKSVLKRAFGITANNEDLSYLASKAIRAAMKRIVSSNTNITDTRYSKVVPDSQQQESTEPDFEEFNIDSFVNGQMSEDKRNAIKTIGKLRSKKIEQTLIVDEKEAYNLLKQVKVSFLQDEDANNFVSIAKDFIETRSRQKEPPATRQNEVAKVLQQVKELIIKSDEAHFEFLKDEFPDVITEDQTFESFYRDIKLVVDKINQAMTMEEILPNKDISDEEINVESRIQDLQELLREDNDALRNIADRMVSEVAFDSPNDALGKFFPILKELSQETLASRRKFVADYINSLLTDIDGLTFKEKRMRLYSLHSLITDGYPLYANNFISDYSKNIIQQNIGKEVFPYIKEDEIGGFTENVSSFATKIRRLGPKLADLMFKLVTPFREGVNKSEIVQERVIKPFLDESLRKAQKIDGKQYNQEELNRIGIYGYLIAHKANETQSQGLKANINYLRRSIGNYSQSFDKSWQEASKLHNKIIEDLIKDVDIESATAIDDVRNNAKTYFSEGILGYHQDIVDMFNMLKPLARFNSEFAYGRPFDEWVNYIPAFSVKSDSKSITDDSQHFLSIDDHAEAVGMFDKDKNMQRKGMSAVQDRTRQLGDNRILVFNLNHLAENRARLSMLDFFTATERRELTNLLSDKGSHNKEFRTWINDKKGDQGRMNLIYKSVLQHWRHSIQGASFASKYDVYINSLTRLVGSVKLSSAYQFFAQGLSNVLPFFVVNINDPRKSARFFTALGVVTKYYTGNLDERSQKTVGRILEGIRMRKLDASLDKSVKLNISGKEMFQTLKASPLFGMMKDINGLRENIMFSQFKYSDMVSGEPILLAEYISNEIEAGRGNEQWDGITYNEESYFKALDETERFIGVGAGTRRGAYLHNGNWMITMLRNILTSFASHRINNATNFSVELSKIKAGHLTPEEVNKSIRYMMGIAAQSISFGAVKWGINIAILNVIMGFLEDDENEDKLKAMYKKQAQGNLERKDLDVLKQEISLREKIRADYNAIKDRSNNKQLLGINILKDTIANSFILPAAWDVPVNYATHILYDEHSALAFQQVKEGKVAELKKKIENAKNLEQYSKQAELMTELRRTSSQEFLKASFESKGFIPFDGSYGMALEDVANFGTQLAKKINDPQNETLSMYDFSILAGTLGVGQADMIKFLKLREKKEETEKEYEKKIQAVKEKARKKELE